LDVTENPLNGIMHELKKMSATPREDGCYFEEDVSSEASMHSPLSILSLASESFSTDKQISFNMAKFPTADDARNIMLNRIAKKVALVIESDEVIFSETFFVGSNSTFHQQVSEFFDSRGFNCKIIGCWMTISW